MASKKHVFTQFEKKVFLDILKVYSHIIENKNSDGSTLQRKNMAWESITREYNMSPHVTTKVSNKQLRRLWINLKQRHRDALTKKREKRMATGAGPSTSSALIDPNVTHIARGLMVEILGSTDSDTTVSLGRYSNYEDVTLDMDSNEPDLSLDINQQPPDMPPTSPSLTTTTPAPHRITTPSPPPNTTPPPCVTTPSPPCNTTIPHPSTVSTPPFPNTSTSPPCASLQRLKNTILQKEYRDRLNRAREIHAMEKELLKHKIREAKAKADLMQLLLQRECSLEDGFPMD